MPQPKSSSLVRACLLSASFSLAAAPTAFADIVVPSPELPPASSVYFVPSTCIATICLENIQLDNIVVTSNMISGGNDVTMSNVDLMANVFQNVAGNPGPPIGSLLLTGQVDITYFARTTLSDSGTFDAQITSLNLSGSFGGHTVDAMLNPNQPSLGKTTDTLIPGTPPTFQITSYFDLFAELSIDGGAYVPGPERTADLGAAPEPGYYLPIGAGLVVLVVRRRGARAKLLTSQRLRIAA